MGVGDESTLEGWAVQRQPRCRRVRSGECGDGLRFAFYGRTSTEDYQDRASSEYWQRDVAEKVIFGRGVVVAKFFDSGYSRRLPWVDRPGAAALLAAVADPDRGFDAIVVGEFERAFCGNQLQRLMPVFDRCGVQLWLPETDGPLDLNDVTHQALMLLLGAQSRREVLRSRHRVTAARRAQVCEQGRFLGGRPPYGYRLVDAGPHPNRAHAQWGRRLRRLDSDPATAQHVRWMFSQRLAGRSVAGIARELNERGVSCRRMWIQPETAIVLVRCGRCGRWRRFWRTRGTRVVRCGTGKAVTTTRHTASGVGRYIDGTRCRTG